MTSLDQASESQEDTNEQQTMDQHTGEHGSGNGTAQDHRGGPTPNEEHRDEEISSVEQAGLITTGEPISADARTEERSTDRHPSDSFEGHEDAVLTGLQTPPHSEQILVGQNQENCNTGAEGGSNSEGLPSESNVGEDDPHAEKINALMDDLTTEVPDDALGQVGPGASAGHPASAELAESGQSEIELNTQTETETLSIESGTSGSETAPDSADGAMQGSGLDSEPARDGSFMQTFFEDLLSALGVQGSIVVRGDNQDEVTLEIRNCPDASLIIGRHGQTVDDLQYLGSLVLNNNRRDRRRFMLNVENYRERREESLRQSAITLAHQVAELGQEAVLDPLPPHERRIVHMALVDITEVYTYSEGVEPDRRIVISPRNSGGVPVTDEGVEELDKPAPEVENDPVDSDPVDSVASAPEGVNTEDNAGALNEDFGENESLTQQLERDPTEFGLADEEPASREDGSSTGHKFSELDGDEPTLPDSTPGGGSHGGHTGED